MANDVPDPDAEEGVTLDQLGEMSEEERNANGPPPVDTPAKRFEPNAMRELTPTIIEGPTPRLQLVPPSVEILTQPE